MALFDTIRAGASGAADDYQIDRSLRFNNDDSSNLRRTPSSDGNRQTFTVSVWVKRANLGEQVIFDAFRDDSNRTRLLFDAGNRMRLFQRLNNNSHGLIIEAVQRDIAAWYHLIWAIDTTQSTSSNRVKMYVNGVQQEFISGSSQPDQNEALFINKDELHAIGVGLDSGGDEAHFDGYLAEFNLIDGQQLTPSSFAETDSVTGEYKPIKYTGSYGTNGFYLNFSDNSNNTAATLGKDSSGNGHNFTPNNLAATDSVKDSPTNNFCVWNTLDARGNDSTFSEGNLKCFIANQGDDDESGATFAVSSGKWYWEEFMQTSTDNAGNVGVGVKTVDFENFWRVRGNGGESDHNGSQATVSGLSWTNGDIISILLDLDDGSWKVAKNGTLIDTKIHTNVSGTVTPMMHNSNSSERHTFITNWGQDSSFAGTKTAQGNTDGNGQGDFHYSVPSGYLALCSKNLPNPTINNGNQHFDVLTYSGNGGSQSLTGLEFSPDWVWTKNRTGGNSHVAYDVLRGATKQLLPNLTHGETTQSDGLTSFDSGGFSAGSNGAINGSGGSYVAWCWDAGTSTVTNNDGSTSAQVRAKPECGFSICTWTGTGSNLTIGHGLGVKPTMHITKARSGASVDNSCSWFVYFSSKGAEKNLRLQTDSSLSDTNDLYNDTEPTSSVITIGNSICINANGGTYVTYVFTDVDGYSRSGIHKGNGNTDGTFVFTGFRPAWIMVKRTNGSENWAIWDYKREGINPTGHMLRPDSDTDEGGNVSGHFIDILSNGFKFRNTDTKGNGNNDDYVYFAIAQRPFKIARAM